MRKILSKKILAAGMTLAISGLLVAPVLVGAAVPDPSGDTQNYGLGSGAGFQTIGLSKKEDLKATIANIINLVLGFLGVIAVIIILAGGFKWMTAGGSEDKVGEARKMIIQGVIGLVIVFTAWGITSFVLTQLKTVTGTGT